MYLWQFVCMLQLIGWVLGPKSGYFLRLPRHKVLQKPSTCVINAYGIYAWIQHLKVLVQDDP